MKILGGNFFQLSNVIFHYGLTPIQLAVYSNLVSRAGQKGDCFPSMKKIAGACGCSDGAARMATAELCRLGFIRMESRYMELKNGKRRQTSNRYFILELPNLPVPVKDNKRGPSSNTGEINEQDEEEQIKTPA